MRAAFALLLVTAAALLPARAQAWPVSERLDLRVGSESIVRSFAQAIAVDDPSIVAAEMLPSNEVLLTPKRAGRALLFLLNDGQLDAVRLRVRETGGELPVVKVGAAEVEAARRACPKLQVEGSGESRSLTAEGVGAACRAALKELLKADEFRVKDLTLMFTDDGVKDQLAEIERRLKDGGVGDGIKPVYVGVTLRLTGNAPLAQKLELLQVAFDSSVGRVLLDDRVEVPPEPAKPNETVEAPAADAPPEIQVEVVPMPPEELKKQQRRTRKNREESR